MKKLWVIGILFLFANSLFADNSKEFIKKGNSYYSNKRYKSAEVEYRKALEMDPTNNYAKFNLGNAYYRQGNYEEALKQFDAVNRNKINKNDLSKAYYNLGNTMMQSKKYEDAIETYKKALINNPDDFDAKYNLEYARRLLQQQIQAQNQQNKNDKKQQGEQKEKQNNQTNKNQQNKSNQNQKDNQENQQQSAQEQQNKSQEQNKNQQPKISKQEAERILQALNNEEQKLQKKMKTLKADRGKLEKNW
jgi:tetratricopeptide (TPR) repeat protein